MIFDFLFSKARREKNFIPTRPRIINSKIKPVVLLSLDGWGMAPDSDGNAISRGYTPYMDYFVRAYPHGELIASGESVGLPANEDGNSEVGHLMMGAGRVVPQSLKRINTALNDGSFFQNLALLHAIDHALKNNSKLHLVGLVSSGNVHASLPQYLGLCKLVGNYPNLRVYSHLFCDGRDAAPKEALNIIATISQPEVSNNVKIASVSGRYYGMDRDRRWERTKMVYDAMTLGKGLAANSATAAIEQEYVKNHTDEFIEPTCILNSEGKFEGIVEENDAIIFFNFRVDRARQMVMPFAMPDFEQIEDFELGVDTEHGKTDKSVDVGNIFKREKVFKNLYITTMTQYQKKIPVGDIAFKPETVIRSLPEVLSLNGIKQLRLAESEKDKMVTY
jgi:2,3-bisphosphoglycerate-independent phosphoglycerate mutase